MPVPAVLGTARLANFRLGYLTAAQIITRRIRAATVSITLDGVSVQTRVLMQSLAVRDVLNDAPNTCSFQIRGTPPTVAQTLRVWVGLDTPVLLFRGTIQTVDLTFIGKPSQPIYSCAAIDDGARANRRRPFGAYVQVSATVIARALISGYVPGFSYVHVQAGLPEVSIIFDGSDTVGSCLGRLATLVGGYFYFEDLDLHFFVQEASDTPDPLDSSHRFDFDPPVAASTDLSQIRTRVYGKGHGEAVLLDVAVGDTAIPIADTVMFNADGGQVLAGTTPDGAQSQILAYAGVQRGGVGSLVGPGAAPSAQPTGTPAIGPGIGSGSHEYAYTFVTAAGESLPGPRQTLIVGGALADPTVAPTTSNHGGAADSWGTGTTYFFRYAYSNAALATDLTNLTRSSPVSTVLVTNGTSIDIALPYAPDYGVKWVVIYLDSTNPGTLWRTYTGGGVLVLANNGAGGTLTSTLIANNITGPYTLMGTVNTTTSGSNRVDVAGIALGPAGTTARKVYRSPLTPSGTPALQLQQTIANNTATVGVQDATPDASLGANPPGSDTSGLTQPSGQVNAGSTSLLTASAAPFALTGGWATIAGDQTIRYTGITGNTLTGIPATGVGAILTTVLYGSQVSVAPTLTGVTGLLQDMQRGASVHIWVQRDDLVAQAAMAALDGGDGIYEALVSDERRGEASLSALCDANLALFANPLVTVTYATRDPKTKSGKTIVVNLASPPISQTLTIQDVTISEINQSPGVMPKFTVTASSLRWSLDDLLRRLLKKAA